VDPARLQDFARRYARAWSTQDPRRVAAFYAESGSLSVNGGAPAIGRQAIAEVARGFMTAFPDMEVSCDELRERPDGTAFHWTLKGTNTGPGGTGKRVCISGHELWQLDADGLIARSNGHYDDAEYQRQLQHGVGD
jgi:steroid delta-isomerase-like uncharacterized protein